MEKSEKNQRKELGNPEHLNKNCWLVKSLNYAPYKRCQYCELKFRDCLFLHYQIISLILVIFFLVISLLIDGRISESIIISIFTLVIVYGYFFNKSTDKIIQANFTERKAKDALEELSENLQEKVDEQTKELQESYQKVEKAYAIEKEAHKELQRTDAAKTQFILATQHHLRTPLSGLKGYLSMVTEGSFGAINDVVKQKLSSCYVLVERLIKLVNEFLDISQFQLGRDILDLKETSLSALLQEAFAEVKPEAEKKGIYLTLEKPTQIADKIMADAPKLKEAFYNLIDNAVKYTEQGGVTIKLQTTNDKLQPTSYKLLTIIQDTGIGMTPEETKEVFSYQFERGEQAKKVYTLGRGIGLYLAANIIKEHKGKIWAESPGRGKGSTFYVELPVK